MLGPDTKATEGERIAIIAAAGVVAAAVVPAVIGLVTEWVKSRREQSAPKAEAKDA